MNLVDLIINFLHVNFILPLIDETVHYNIYNTAFYAILLSAFVVYLGIPYIRKLGVEIDRKLFIAVTPFIFLGGAARTLHDAGIVDSLAFVTPFIYILMFLLTSVIVLGSKKISNYLEISYHVICSSVGTVLLFTVLGLLWPFNLTILPEIMLVIGLWAFIFYLILRYVKPEYMDLIFTFPVVAHLLDATTTFTGVRNGAEEKHVVADLFIQIFGPVGIFFIKLAVIVPVVYYIYERMEGEQRAYYLFIITLLGLGIATRNFLSLISV